MAVDGATRRRLAAGAGRVRRRLAPGGLIESGLVAVAGDALAGPGPRIPETARSDEGAASKRGGADDRPDYPAALALVLQAHDRRATTTRATRIGRDHADQLVAHAVGDHVLQSDWCANEKTKWSAAAAIHVAPYVVPFLLLAERGGHRDDRCDALRSTAGDRLPVCWAKN